MKLFLGLLAWLSLCAANAQTPVEGRQYRELRPALPAASARVEVIEFFYYGCPVCYEVEPRLARWLATEGKSVALRRVPAPFSESSESFARTFYALDAMNEGGRLHWPLYDNHHFDGRKLDEYANIVRWVAANGVDRARFEALWKSDAVSARVAEAKKTVAAYQVSGVPSLVVDGKYLTSAKMAGGTREMVRVLDYLVQRAAKERRK